jgi:hypothetical protein
MKSRKAFPLRINPRLYNDLEAWAKQEMRSVNAQIVYLLKEAVAKRNWALLDHERPQTRPDDEAPEAPGDT